MTTQPSELQEVIEQIEAASTAFQRKDSAPLAGLFAESDDVVLFGAKGGVARGHAAVSAVTGRASAALGNTGASRYEVLAAKVEGSLGYLVALQHLGPTTEAQVTLRVTLVFERIDGRWRLLVRHADGLVENPFIPR